MIDVNSARRQMIEQQVRAWDVLDLAVLEAMTRVPREEFAPPPYRDLAFADMNVPLGHGQHMLAPKLEGRILQSLALGLTPDRPDPAGTVNRVVQGVTIHPWNGAGGHVSRR